LIFGRQDVGVGVNYHFIILLGLWLQSGYFVKEQGESFKTWNTISFHDKILVNFYQNPNYKQISNSNIQ
jgi:hypothetical protein